MLSLAFALALEAQTVAVPQVAPPAPSGKAVAPSSEVLEINLDTSGRVVRARLQNVTLAAAAKRLGEILKVSVKVAPALARNRVRVSKMEDAPLANLLLAIAPVAYLDTHEVLGQAPVILGVHFLEAGPSAAPEVASEAIAMQGSTEDEAAGSEGSATAAKPLLPAPSPSPTSRPDDVPFLDVRRMDSGRVSVEARDQGLGVLLFAVAQAYGVRFDLRIPESPMVGRLSVIAVLPSELPAYLGVGGVGVDVRRNLATGEEKPLRFFVEQPQ